MFLLGKSRDSVSSQGSRRRDCDEKVDHQRRSVTSVTSACPDLESLSIRVARLDAEVAVASRRSAAVEGMMTNAEQWLERKLQDYGDQLLNSLHEQLEEHVAHLVQKALPVAELEPKMCAPSPQDEQTCTKEHQEHAPFALHCLNIRAESPKRNVRKRPSVKPLRKSAAHQAPKSETSESSSTGASVPEHDASSRAAKRTGLRRLRRKCTESPHRIAAKQDPLECERTEMHAAASFTGAPIRKHVALPASSSREQTGGTLILPPKGIEPHALTLLTCTSSVGGKVVHESMSTKLPMLGIAVLQIEAGVDSDQVEAMAHWVREDQGHPDMPIALVGEGTPAAVATAVHVHAGTNDVKGVAIHNASSEIDSSSYEGMIASGVQLMIHDNRSGDATEKILVWLPQLLALVGTDDSSMINAV